MPKDKWTKGKQFTHTTENGVDVYTPIGNHTDFLIVGQGDKRKIAPVGYDFKNGVDKLPVLDTDIYDNNVKALQTFAPQATTAKVVEMPKQDFSSWGNQADVAQKQGWYPEVSFGNEVHYKSKYDPAFNTVLIPNQKETGYIGVVGHPNNKMDIVIKDKGGNIVRPIKTGVTPEDVQAYTKQLVASRDASVRAGTNPDKKDKAGGYTELAGDFTQ